MSYWEEHMQDGVKAMKEAKSMDPKFKWDKLETNYEQRFQTLTDELERASADYEKRYEYYQRLSFHYENFEKILRNVFVVSKADSVYEKFKNADLKNFRDTVEKVKAEYPICMTSGPFQNPMIFFKRVFLNIFPLGSLNQLMKSSNH